jgi:cysteine desulfurase
MRVYLDHNATTPLDPLVADRMAQAMRDVWGNASSDPPFRSTGQSSFDQARGAVGSLIGADASRLSSPRRHRERQPRDPRRG